MRVIVKLIMGCGLNQSEVMIVTLRIASKTNKKGLVGESEDADGGLDMVMYGKWIKAVMMFVSCGFICYISCELLSKWFN